MTSPATRTPTKERGITKRSGSTGTTFEVTISAGTHPNGKRRQIRQSFKSFADAKDFRTKTLHQLREASYVEPSREKVSAFFARWLESKRHLRISTQVSYAGNLQRLPSLHDLRLCDLTPAKIHDALDALSRAGASVRTQQLSLATLRACLDTAVKQRLLRDNPARLVDAPRQAPRTPRVLTGEQVKAFRAANVDDPYRPLWETALETGMRLGELAALRWQDVGFDERVVRVERTVTIGKQTRVVGPPKTKAGRRTIAISAELVAILRAHRVGYAERKLQEPEWNPEGLVFPNSRGTWAWQEQWRRPLMMACARAGIVPAIPFHSLRHTSATLQIAAGIDIKTVSERLGHTSVAITLNLYVHPDSQTHRNAADLIGERLRGSG